ncbi:uncharacterized protein [Nicotiana tomentosiformis]|uniref:uncharacterized protein n=1 Tax=Nicotiana tomentosiformis TaxID=4098 RepID=UPI00388C46F5
MSLVEQSERLEIYETQREEITNEMRYFIEVRAELGQEIDKFGTTIHDLETQLNTKVDASNAQQNSNELCKAENELICQIEELKVESKSLEHIFVDDALVEKTSTWFSGAVPDLAGWVFQLVSTSSYAERSWHNLAKGRWEDKNYGKFPCSSLMLSCEILPFNLISSHTGLGDSVVMRSSPFGGEKVPKPTKDKKRRRALPPDTPRPKKSRARKSNLAVLPADVVQKLQDEDEEGEDTDCLLVAQKRGSIEASKAIEPVMVEGVQPQTEVILGEGPSRVPESSGIDDAPCRDEQPAGVPEGSSSEALQIEENAPMLHRKTSSKYLAELARCEADLKKLTEERNALKILYVHKEEEIKSIRTQLTRAHEDQTELIERVQQKAELVEQLRGEAKMKEAETLGWKQTMDHLASEKDAVRAQLSSVELQLQSVKVENLARAQKVEELKTRLATELARATSKAKALVTSYRADAEAANTRAKKIYDVADVRLSRVADYARRQSRRETFEEVHARGFDLSADIENAKILEDEVGALLSDDEDSATGSESGGDEDDATEDAAPEAD